LEQRPLHLGKRAEKHVDVDLTGAWDPSTGMQYAKKRFLYPEIFRLRFDPDSIAKSPPLPVGVESVAKEVFGEMYPGTVKLALHPWFKRWCLWEKVEGTKTAPAGWVCFQMFSKRDTQKDDYLPADLRFEDHRADDLRGRVGDYAPPDRQSLEWVKGHCDHHRRSVEEVMQTIQSRQTDKSRANASEHESMLHDFHSYYFNYFRDLANVEEGCASKSMQCNQASHDELDRRKWEREKSYIIEFEGTKHRVRKGSSHEQWLFGKMETKKQAEEEARKRLIDHSYIVEEQLDRRSMMNKAKRLSLGLSDSKAGHNGKMM